DLHHGAGLGDGLDPDRRARARDGERAADGQRAVLEVLDGEVVDVVGLAARREVEQPRGLGSQVGRVDPDRHAPGHRLGVVLEGVEGADAAPADRQVEELAVALGQPCAQKYRVLPSRWWAWARSITPVRMAAQAPAGRQRKAKTTSAAARRD